MTKRIVPNHTISTEVKDFPEEVIQKTRRKYLETYKPSPKSTLINVPRLNQKEVMSDRMESEWKKEVGRRKT